MYSADEMVPKRENGQAAIRLTRYIMLASLFHIAPLIDIPILSHNACPCRCNAQVDVWFIRMYER